MGRQCEVFAKPKHEITVTSSAFKSAAAISSVAACFLTIHSVSEASADGLSVTFVEQRYGHVMRILF
jgi:hypothetical protein